MELYSGSGNTFYLIDRVRDSTEVIINDQLVILCERTDVDGWIIMNSTTYDNISIHIFNRDGSEADMCGNGLCCVVQFLWDLGIHREVYTLNTRAGIYEASHLDGRVCIQFPKSYSLRIDRAEPFLHDPYGSIPCCSVCR